MSDTPRTLEALTQVLDRDGRLEDDNAPFVLVKLAKTLERELNAAKAEISDNLALIKRLHRAISARICADEPTSEERLELRRAWREAGAVLDQPSALESLTTDNDSNVK